MRQASPDVFVHCGDTIYADQPLAPEVPLDGGGVWRNLVTPAKSKVAETLEEYRGNYLYNLLDANLRRFNSEVAQIAIWDDHEVRDNWYPGRSLAADRRYRQKNIAKLAAFGRRAFIEHMPVRLRGGRLYRSVSFGPLLDLFDLRSYRGPNTANRQPAAGPETRVLGRAQMDWLRRRLLASSATWKVIVSSLPLGLLIPDGPGRFEGVANGDGPPCGRELEMAELLTFIRDARIRNVVWIAGDVHYAAAHHYDPARARYRAFLPFWEFVAGPIHAGTFGPNPLDDTFGPEVRFLSIPPGMKPNRPPSEGLQFFGTLHIDGRTRALTARLHDLSGAVLYRVELAPEA